MNDHRAIVDAYLRSEFPNAAIKSGRYSEGRDRWWRIEQDGKIMRLHVSEEYLTEESEHAARVRLTNFDVAKALRGSIGRLVVLTDRPSYLPNMPPGPRTERYLRATVIFQPERVASGWVPRCIIVCGFDGKKREHRLKLEPPRATEQQADDATFERAKIWIDEHNDQMTGYSWTTETDEESKSMWPELGPC